IPPSKNSARKSSRETPLGEHRRQTQQSRLESGLGRSAEFQGALPVSSEQTKSGRLFERPLNLQSLNARVNSLGSVAPNQARRGPPQATLLSHRRPERC